MFGYRISMGLMLLILAISSCAEAARDQPPPPAAEPVPTETLFPLDVHTDIFRVTDGENLNQRLPLSLRPTQDAEPGEWVLEFSDLNTLYLSVDASGDILLVRLDLPPDNMALVYDPPVRMLPAEIRPHVHIEEQSKVRVYDLKTGELQHTGTVEHQVMFASRSRFGTDIGVFEGYLVPVEQQIDLPWTKVRLELAAGYVPGLGIVYRRVEYTRKTFGLFAETFLRAAVLSEEAK